MWSDLDSDSQFYATPFNPAEPLTTPSGLNTSSAATPLTWLAAAVQNLEAHGVPMDASIGQVQSAPQSRRIPIPGCPGDASSSGKNSVFQCEWVHSGRIGWLPLATFAARTVYAPVFWFQPEDGQLMTAFGSVVASRIQMDLITDLRCTLS